MGLPRKKLLVEAGSIYRSKSGKTPCYGRQGECQGKGFHGTYGKICRLAKRVLRWNREAESGEIFRDPRPARPHSEEALRKSSWNWKEASLGKVVAEKLGRRFEVGFYEAALAADSENLEVLVSLGNLYAQQGLLEKGLEIDQRLVQMRPRDPRYHYSLACSHSLLGHIDPGLAALSHALQLGYNKVEKLTDDPDLDNLKRDSRYHKMVRELLSNKAKGS